MRFVKFVMVLAMGGAFNGCVPDDEGSLEARCDRRVDACMNSCYKAGQGQNVASVAAAPVMRARGTKASASTGARTRTSLDERTYVFRVCRRIGVAARMWTIQTGKSGETRNT